MAVCTDCGAKIGLLNSMSGRCKACHLTFELARANGISVEDAGALMKEHLGEAGYSKPTAPDVMLTTEVFCPDLRIIERKGIITAEVAEGMNVFKDVFTDIRGAVGGRSKIAQETLRSIREAVLHELKFEAARIGANAVIAVDLDYQELSTTGRFLFVVASGTAVLIETSETLSDQE